jgi:hypothetical protein
VQQETHHVGLGEELGDRRQLVSADLRRRLVNCILLGRAPELIGPTKAVLSREHRRVEIDHQLLKCLNVLRRERQCQHGIIRLKDRREHGRSVALGHCPAVR